MRALLARWLARMWDRRDHGRGAGLLRLRWEGSQRKRCGIWHAVEREMDSRWKLPTSFFHSLARGEAGMCWDAAVIAVEGLEPRWVQERKAWMTLIWVIGCGHGGARDVVMYSGMKSGCAGPGRCWLDLSSGCRALGSNLMLIGFLDYCTQTQIPR